MAIHEPPPVGLADSDNLRRIQFRLWQIALAMLTLLLTAWFFSVNVMLGIISLFLAKHVLVAILVAGLHLPPKKTNH